MNTIRPAGDIVPITRASDACEVGLAAYQRLIACSSPFEIEELSRPAGARFGTGAGGGCLHLHAVEFCRLLSGRAPIADPDVVVEADPAAVAQLLETRVLF